MLRVPSKVQVREISSIHDECRLRRYMRFLIATAVQVSLCAAAVYSCFLRVARPRAALARGQRLHEHGHNSAVSVALSCIV